MNSYFKQGIKDSFPIVLGYIPIGLTLGLTAREAGFLLRDMFVMSSMVFAGSAQFIGVNLIGANTTMITIIATTFIINFRHFMMSSAYSPYFKDEKLWVLALVSFGITDESFAIGINKAKYDNDNFSATYLIALESTAWLSWLISTCSGLYLGSLLPNYSNLGLGFALCAMFIGLIAIMAKTRTHILICVLAGIFSIILYEIGFTNFNIIIAATLCASIPLAIKLLKGKRENV